MAKKHTKVQSYKAVNNKNINQKKDDIETIHVMLASPLALRKTVLGSALDLANTLKTCAELKEIKQSKSLLIETFYSLHNDIKKLVRDLEKRDLPNISAEEQDEFELHEIKQVKEYQTEDIHPAEETTNMEIEKLKAELASIEKKLDNI